MHVLLPIATYFLWIKTVRLSTLSIYIHHAFLILYFNFSEAVILCMMPIFFCITGCVVVVKDIKITAGTCKRKILLLVLIFVCHFSDNIYVHVNVEAAFLPQWGYMKILFFERIWRYLLRTSGTIYIWVVKGGEVDYEWSCLIHKYI